MDRSISWTEPSALRSLATLAKQQRVRPAPALVPAPVAPPARERPPFEAIDGPLEERVEHLVEWVAGSTPLDGVFITDAHGLAIANRGVDAAHVAISATLMQTLASVRENLATNTRRMAIAIRSDLVLHLVAMETAFGSFGVGMLGNEFLSDDFLSEAQTALLETLGGEAHGE